MNIEEIKKLRQETGAGVVDAKTALEDAKGDFNVAKVALKEKGFSTALKKSGRDAKQGIVSTYSHLGKVGVIVELACETDFVARNELFKEVAHDLTLQVASMKPESVEELLTQTFIKDDKLTIADLIRETIVKTGENVFIKRFARIELGVE